MVEIFSNNFIPVHEPLFDGNEKKYLCACIDAGWVSSEGPFVKKFEDAFASFIGVRHGIAVSNGTAAIETALYALGITHGDEIIMPSFTIISCALACMRLGAVPVLVDIDPETWTIDPDLIEAKITSSTKAIMPVHMYGHPVSMDKIFYIREKYNLKIIEDAAEVHGAAYFSEYYGGRWMKCGAMGDVAATSFYANKIITTGEGGMVLTNDPACADRAREYRNLCFKPEKRFFHTEIGYNFRMTNLQAALGLAQLEQIERFLALKKQVAAWYRQYLCMIKGIRLMVVRPWANSVYWMFCLELDPSLNITAEEMMERLHKYNIGTRPFFLGLHVQPALQHRGLFQNESYPKTDMASRYGFYLPSGLTLNENDIARIAEAIKLSLKK